VFFTARFDLGGRPPNTAISFEWRYGDGVVEMAGQTTSHVYSLPGTFTVTVTLFVLASRETATDSTIAQISPTTPAVTASAGGPYSGTAGQPVVMTGSLNQAGVAATDWSWNFGDGTSGSGQTVQATYRQAGTFTVTLTVRLANGATVTATTTATIAAAQPQGDVVQLFAGCNNVAMTWPVGTPMTTVASAVSPPSALMSIFRFDAAAQRFFGFSPTAPSFANDYTAVLVRLEAVFMCMSGPATLLRPDPSVPAPPAPTPTLVGPLYRWQETLLNNGQRFVPPNPSSYTLQLFPDGTAAAQADCNRASGSYTLNGNQLTLSFLAVTLAACPPGSLSDQYLQQLNGVSSFFFQNGQLFLSLMFDSGTMRFSQ
jgi:PKD repeat protein